MTNVYKQLKDKHQEEVNNFPMAFAFSNSQFESIKETLGVTSNSELVTVGSGGFIRKADASKFSEMLKRQDEEMKANYTNPDFVYAMFRYELNNHEFMVTYSTWDALNALGMTQEEVDADPMMKEQLSKAVKDIIDFYKNGN